MDRFTVPKAAVSGGAQPLRESELLLLGDQLADFFLAALEISFATTTFDDLVVLLTHDIIS